MVGNRRKSINSKNKIICVQCKTQVLESDDAFQCDACKKTLHSVCTKMDKKRIDKLLKDPSLEYECHFCEKTVDNTVVSDLAEIKTKLNQLDDIKETIQFMASQYDEILKGVAKNKKKIENLQKENTTLRNEVKQLKSSVKYLNDIRVQNDCIINGINVENDNVTPLEVVLKIAKKTGADICEDEVDDAYFLKVNDKSLKKSLVVKFNNKKSKKAFMNEKAKIKQIDDLKSIYINDFLCKESLEVFNHAKTLKTVGYKFVYSKGGNIFAKKDEKSRQIRIYSMGDVDKMLLSASGGRSMKSRAAIVNDENSDEDDDDDGENFRSPN